jgi:hypothetical protein
MCPGRHRVFRSLTQRPDSGLAAFGLVALRGSFPGRVPTLDRSLGQAGFETAPGTLYEMPTPVLSRSNT